MKATITYLILFLSVFACQEASIIDREIDFNKNWKFSLDEYSQSFKCDFDDSEWRTVHIPHDWSVEFPFDSVKGEGCTAYLPGGVGWYRKHFKSDHGIDEKVYIHFDGVYNNSELWINGEKLGEHPYGYSPFYFDLTDHLKGDGQDNVISVKVDRSRYADSRWYTGSGIYRNVVLINANKLHIPVWGTFITTPKVNKEEAQIDFQIQVKNDFTDPKTFTLETQIYNSTKELIAIIHGEEVKNMKPGQSVFKQSVNIVNPELWALDSPHLYTAVTTLHSEGIPVDQYTTKFGVRSFRWDVETGFYLNEENMKIKGVCLHHDGGLVGSAVPKGVWKRRLQILKDGGCNAIRISHNPASDEFLDLCDEMGFLVQDEFFDEWDHPKDKRLNMQEQHDDYISRGYGEHFQEWAKFDLKNTMLAHRNHPSVFQWSIGNEIEWTYPRNKKATGFFDNMDWQGSYFWSPTPFTPERIKKEYESQPAGKYEIGKTAQKLAKWTKELDTTRPVIANCILPSASFETGYADALDIVGFSYRRVMYDYARKNYPDKIVMGTENLPQYHEWKAIEERPFVSGTFLWTGIDYMGERNGQWPTKTLASGLLDQAGFKNPSYHMYKTLWQDDACLFLCTQSADKSQYQVNSDGKVEEKKPGQWKQRTWIWYPVNEHWNYTKGKDMIVEVISNCEEVELFINDKSLGTKLLSDFPDRIYKWALPFEKGNLVAKGKKGSEFISSNIQTAKEPVTFTVNTDKNDLRGDNRDVSHIIVQLVDADGNPVKHTERTISFELDEKLNALGVDNGKPSNTQTYQSNTIQTHEGKAMLIVQSLEESGNSEITVSGKGLEDTSISIKISK